MELVAANQTLQAQAQAVVSAASERAQGVAREAELVVAAEWAEAAARVAAIQAQATAALATERTGAAAEATDLRATNDLLLAIVAAAEQRAEMKENSPSGRRSGRACPRGPP
jgi:hypothetical protein